MKEVTLGAIRIYAIFMFDQIKNLPPRLSSIVSAACLQLAYQRKMPLNRLDATAGLMSAVNCNLASRYPTSPLLFLQLSWTALLVSARTLFFRFQQELWFVMY